MMNINATNRMANMDVNFANTLMLLLMYSLITGLLCQVIITLIMLTLYKHKAELKQTPNMPLITDDRSSDTMWDILKLTILGTFVNIPWPARNWDCLDKNGWTYELLSGQSIKVTLMDCNAQPICRVMSTTLRRACRNPLRKFRARVVATWH